jgi:preprotein translocase subunit SecG
MTTVIIVIHLMLVLAMIGVIMLQKSEGGGLGIGSAGGFMTSRGTANVLTRATAILAAGFFITSLVLSIIAGHDRRPSSIIQGPAPASNPASSGGGVLDQLRGGPPQQPGAPAAPAAPSGPEVPQSK